jgi:hypothetical protein
MNKWWGYIHTNGSVQAKRYFDPLDIQEARESPFVAQVVLPFDAESREDALDYVAEHAGEQT